jgi:hypothetical protein
MGNRTKRPPGRPKQQQGRPSLFFIIALAIGIAVLMWMFAGAVRKPATPKAPPTTTSMLIERSSLA